MIYLILKMFAYLLLALLAGVGAGWILRHLAAARQEEDVQRTLADARARVPQFESLIRSRDEQINRLKDDLKEKDSRINGLVAEVREAENALKEKTRAFKTLIAQRATPEDLSSADAPAADGTVIGRGDIRDPGDDADTASSGTIAELEKRLAQKTMDYERLARDLEVEQRRLAELERERQLQNKSLRVLHQQLELERERGQRVASG